MPIYLMLLLILTSPVLGQDEWTPDPAIHDDLARRGMDESLWEPEASSSYSRHRLINARAKLIALGLWDDVTFISLGTIGEGGEPEFPLPRGWHVLLEPEKVLHRKLMGHAALWAASIALGPLRHQPGFFPQPNGHEEGDWQFKEVGRPGSGSDLVSHFVGLREAPLATFHLDTGYGLPLPRHLDHSPKNDEITRLLLRDDRAREHLRGISPEFDRQARTSGEEGVRLLGLGGGGAW